MKSNIFKINQCKCSRLFAKEHMRVFDFFAVRIFLLFVYAASGRHQPRRESRSRFPIGEEGIRILSETVIRRGVGVFHC